LRGSGAAKRPRDDATDDRPSKRQTTQLTGTGKAAGGDDAPEATARSALDALQAAAQMKVRRLVVRAMRRCVFVTRSCIYDELMGRRALESVQHARSPPDADVMARVLARALDAPEVAWPRLEQLAAAARAADATQQSTAMHAALLTVAAAVARCSEGGAEGAASVTPYEALWRTLFRHLPAMHLQSKVRRSLCKRLVSWRGRGCGPGACVARGDVHLQRPTAPRSSSERSRPLPRSSRWKRQETVWSVHGATPTLTQWARTRCTWCGCRERARRRRSRRRKRTSR
jgi:hypothetical protein